MAGNDDLATDEVGARRSGRGFKVFILGSLLGMVAGVASSEKVKKVGKRAAALATDRHVKMKWSQMTGSVSTTVGQAKDRLQSGVQKISTGAGRALDTIEVGAHKLEEGVHKISTTAGQAKERLQHGIPSVGSLVSHSGEEQKKQGRRKKKHKRAS